MKKQSRKKRNLEYIRFKNKIRQFIPVKYSFKSTYLLNEDNGEISEAINHFINRIEHKYKLNISLEYYKTGLTDNDFCNELYTVVLTLKRLKHNEK